tara:strand:+ start:2428 stop:2706 length:279 start_codon:yes stop_codon:yes gene_type:complete
MRILTFDQLKSLSKTELQKFNHSYQSMIYTDKHKSYYKKYQKKHYAKNKKHRCRTAKALYYKKTYNKEVFFIKPPHNYAEYMKKLNLKIKYC